ncbi:GPI mannosyltransferase 2 isoform X2 [Heliangelus exortis]|uniref:GPI mannosyltransferase 2 isoform X2 n=1 Tax=Heliangelus exortis TaxID=472823 RepID=UPI003A93CC77
MELGSRQDPQLREVVRFAVCCRALTLLLQVLTRFLCSSSPVLYWFCAHLLQEHEPLLRNKGTDEQTVTPLTGNDPGPGGESSCGNPLLGLLRGRGSIAPLSRGLLGFFLTYCLLGLALHCNSLPWT